MVDKNRLKFYTPKNLTEPPRVLNLSKELIQFDIRKQKKKKISEYMCRQVRNKRLIFNKLLTDKSVDIRNSGSICEIRQFVEECSTSSMSRFQRKRILSQLNANELEKLHPQLFNSILLETEEEFMRITQTVGMQLKIKHSENEKFKIESYKFLGKTTNYKSYLKKQKKLHNIWMLHNELVKNFLKQCIFELPHELFHIKTTKLFDLEEIRNFFNEKLTSAAINLQDFQKSVSLPFQTDNFQGILKLIPVCRGLFFIYVSKCIAHTIERLVEFTGVSNLFPYLNLYAKFDESLSIFPAKDKVIEMFHEICDKLIELGNNLSLKVKGQISIKSSLFLTIEFVSDCKTKIEMNIEELYQPILVFLNELNGRFQEIYSDIAEGVAEDLTFEEGSKQIQYYKSYIGNVAHIPDNEYFKIGQLNLRAYRICLEKGLKTLTDTIFHNLSSQHFWEINDICENFDLIKHKATMKPTTTEELIEIGKFMTWVKSEQMEVLNDRVNKALECLYNLINMGNLSETHVRKNAEALSWIDEILPIIEKHTAAYEQLKFEAEEKLQKVIEDVSVNVTGVYPLLMLLDEMDNISNIRSYLTKITLHMTKIKEIQQQIEWINKEEVCLNFPKSNYQEFDNLKEYVYPFYHLLKLSLDVQKHVAVWFHGQFDTLNFAVASKKVAVLSTELENIKKSYRKRLRQAQDENLPIRFKGTVDDPDILNWPAPLKLVQMTLNILEAFKPSLVVMRIMCNKALQVRHWRAMSRIAGFSLMPNAGTTLKKLVEFDFQEKLKEFDIISNCASKEHELLTKLNSLKSKWDDVYFNSLVQYLAEDQIMELSKMLESGFVKPYKEDVKTFQKNLKNIDSVVTMYEEAQRLIDILQPAATAFGILNINDEVLNKISIILNGIVIMKLVTETDILEDLKATLKGLENLHNKIEKSLTKLRENCPRLFMISDEDLIEFIGSKSKLLINFWKIFPGIKDATAKNSNTIITSNSGDIIVLQDFANFPLDVTILNAEKEIQNILKTAINNCYKIFKKSNILDLLQQFPQTTLEAMQKISWTEHVESALKLQHNIKLLIYKKQLQESVDEKVELIQKSTMSNIDRLKRLILTDLNCLHLLNCVMEDKFVWQLQLKYYHHYTTFLNYQQEYGYELSESCLILTSATDRCFVAILHAYFSHCYIFLRGEAQCGKNTIARAVANCLGQLYYFYNCAADMSAKSLKQLLKGIAFGGFWMSLYNVDRLKLETVSTLREDLLKIVECKQTGAKLDFNPRCFVMIHQHEHNNDLPENFKTMFRLFTLPAADLTIIIEALLICQGITDCKKLVKKLTYCIRVIEEVLEMHVDMYSVKQILRHFETSTNTNQLAGICCSLRAIIEPRLSDDNKLLFNQILDNIFCEIGPTNINKLVLEEITKEPLKFSDIFIKKLLQLYDCLKVSKNVILLGDVFTGKTTALKICAGLNERLNDIRICLRVLNTQSVTSEMLMRLYKHIIMNPEVQNWILLDGILDLNKFMSNFLEDGSIYLGNLRNLQLKDEFALIFETTSLANANPSWISQCFIIYFPNESIEVSSIIDFWFSNCQSMWFIEHKNHIKTIFKWFLPSCLKFYHSLDKNFVLTDTMIVQNTLNYFRLILDDAVSKLSKKDEDAKNMITWIHATIIQTGILAFSSSLPQESRQKFDEFYKDLWKGQIKSYPTSFDKLEVGIPSDGLVLDYSYLYKQRGAWKQWTDLLKNEKIVDRNSMILIPTVETTRCSFLLQLHLKYHQKLLVIGPECVGKSIMLKEWYSSRMEKFETNFIKVANFMDEDWFRCLIHSKSPTKDRGLINFVDDLHVDCGFAEVIRQHLDHNLWYDKFFRDTVVENSNTIAASNYNISKRLLRHFNLVGIMQQSVENIFRIHTQTLSYSWKKSGLPSDVLGVVDNLVKSLLKIYEFVDENVKFSLKCPHYLFNIRDLSRIIHGCSLLRKEIYDSNKKVYFKLFTHEVLKVFADRMFSNGANNIFDNIQMVLKEQFPEDDEVITQDVLFSFNESTKYYEEVNMDDVKLYFSQQNTDLLLFDYAIEKLAKIGRLLKEPATNALFLSTTVGCGKRALTKFAAKVYNHRFVDTEITSHFNINTVINNLKETLTTLNGNCIFYIGELEFEDVIETLDHYLRGGQIFDLFNKQEQYKILELRRLDAQMGNPYIEVNPHEVAEYFNNYCRTNLHVILSLSNSKLLRQAIYKYPSIVNLQYVMLWLDWPDESLNFVAKHYLQDFTFDNENQIVVAAKRFHQNNFGIPPQFFHALKLFSAFVKMKKEKFNHKLTKYKQGLEKLSVAQSQIAAMQQSLANYQPQLEAMTQNALKMMEQIALETLEVEKASALVRKDEKVASDQAAIAEVLKSECEAELAQAIPILEDAISALNTLKPSDITLVKSMKNPPDAIKLVMASVCVMKEVKPDRIPDPSTGRKFLDYWGPSKRILGDMNFLQNLKDFDKDHIKAEIILKIRKEYLPHKDFKPNIVAKASSAAEGLCKWVIAMDMYDKVAKEVAPKKEKLHKAEKDYGETMKVLNEKKQEVKRIEEKLAQLNALLSEATKKQINLQKEVDECTRKLNRAQTLIGSLSGEKERWTIESQKIVEYSQCLSGDALIASLTISYPSILCDFNSFTLDFSKNYQLGAFLDCDLMESLVILKNYQKFCIILDPQKQAFDWVVKSTHNAIVTKFTSPNWVEHLKRCLQQGGSIVVKDTKGCIPSCLNSLLLSSSTSVVRFDGEDIKLHESCKVYIVSVNPDCNVQPRIDFVNCSITEENLKHHLVKSIAEVENPTIRKCSEELYEQKRAIANQIKELQFKVLETLCESQKDILEDVNSMDIIDNTKLQTYKVLKSQLQLLELEQTVEQLKTQYGIVANKVTKLFSTLSSFQTLHPTYKFSLEWFKEILFSSIMRAGRSRDIIKRCDNLIKTFTYELFKAFDRGLFEHHKLMFRFWMALNVADCSKEDIFNLFGCVENQLSNIQITQPNDVKHFIKSVLGHQFVAPQTFSLQDIYNQSHCLMPILFLITPGLDVLKLLKDFSNLKQVEHKFLHMESSNFKNITKMLKESQQEGCWLLVENCHIIQDKLNELEKEIEAMDFDNTHENFRLFLTTDPNQYFPLELLQSCLKVVLEPSGSVKENLLRAYTTTPIALDDYYYGCPGKQKEFSKLIFELCQFHYTILNRQRVPNWSLPNVFNETILHGALIVLQNLIESNMMEHIETIIENCLYCCNLEHGCQRKTVGDVLRNCLKLDGLPNKFERNDFIVYITKLDDNFQDSYKATTDILNLGAEITRQPQLGLDEVKLIKTVEELLETFPNKARTNSCNKIILKEVQLYNNLLRVIQNSLENLQKALNGRIVFNGSLEELGIELLKNEIPKTWLKLCYPTLITLGQFANTLNNNIEYLSNFKDNNSSLLLSAFYCPKSILCYNKLKLYSEEQVGFDYEVCNIFGKSIENNVVIIANLHLIGASVDLETQQIVALCPKLLYTTLKYLKLKPRVLQEVYSKSLINVEVSVYRTNATPKIDIKQSFIDSVEFKCKYNDCVNGVYIVCEIN